MSLDLRLTATEYNQLIDPKDPSKSTQRIRKGDEFKAHDQAERDRLVAAGAAVEADAPDPNNPSQLKGDDLQKALEFYGLSDEGRADEKRQRIAAYLEANPDAERYSPAG